VDSDSVLWSTTIRNAGVASVDLDSIVTGFDTETDCGGCNPANSHPTNPDMMAGASVSENPHKTLGALLRVLRCEAELTLDQVASALGVAKPSVWAWENGRTKPKREKWHALAKVLRVDPQLLASAAKAEALNKAASSALLTEDVDRAGMLAAGREMIAKAYGVTPSAVRIMVEI
jgi:transcriptional regulator with XRE-family HTH domain